MNTGLDPATGHEQQSATVELQHPLVRHYLSRLRDVATSPAEFRQLIQRLSAILAYEATRDLAEQTIEVQTPLCKTAGTTLAQRIALVPILRTAWEWSTRCWA